MEIAPDQYLEVVYLNDLHNEFEYLLRNYPAGTGDPGWSEYEIGWILDRFDRACLNANHHRLVHTKASS